MKYLEHDYGRGTVPRGSGRGTKWSREAGSKWVKKVPYVTWDYNEGIRNLMATPTQELQKRAQDWLRQMTLPDMNARIVQPCKGRNMGFPMRWSRSRRIS
jgi:hypothetical protein